MKNQWQLQMMEYYEERASEYDDIYHWHIEIIPKITKVAGFEWGSGFYINPTPPEEAAAFMRELDPSEAEKRFAAKASV